MRASTRTEAFHLFVAGNTLREIAKTLGVHRSTVERWSVSEHWRERRAQEWQRIREECRNTRAESYKAKIEPVYDAVHQLLVDAATERRLFFDGKLGKRKLRISNRAFLSLAKTYAALEAGFIRSIPHKFGDKPDKAG